MMEEAMRAVEILKTSRDSGQKKLKRQIERLN
jgi:hypothetical protein